jgi:hypothetical protein
MKNIHVIPTYKPSRLWLYKNFDNLLTGLTVGKSKDIHPQNIYITSDEKIKEGDWYYTNRFGIGIAKNEGDSKIERTTKSYKKIILTTDQDLIKDGVQAITDEFLEWFVNNPSCEKVDIEKQMLCDYCGQEHCDNLRCRGYKDSPYYEIIIPKEEPKQETLEEAVNAFKKTNVYTNEIKQKQERMYSEEEVEVIAKDAYTMGRNNILIGVFNRWIKQFKKK